MIMRDHSLKENNRIKRKFLLGARNGQIATFQNKGSLLAAHDGHRWYRSDLRSTPCLPRFRKPDFPWEG